MQIGRLFFIQKTAWSWICGIVEWAGLKNVGWPRFRRFVISMLGKI